MAVKRRESKMTPPPPSCPLTACWHLLKGAWTPNALCYLREEPRRFCELMSAIPGVPPKVFSARLKRLEQDGILTHQVISTSSLTVEYA